MFDACLSSEKEAKLLSRSDIKERCTSVVTRSWTAMFYKCLLEQFLISFPQVRHVYVIEEPFKSRMELYLFMLYLDICIQYAPNTIKLWWK